MNDFIIKSLDSQILNNKTSHAYLFEVNNYEDDFSFILNFVKMLLSNKSFDDVVNSDINYFKDVDNNTYLDLYTIEPDGNDIKKNQLLELMDEFSNKSLIDNKKIYIIKECEKLNSSSANTILKFLEEPNENIVAILITNNRYKVIDTILSRCQVFSLLNEKEFKIDDDYNDLINFICSIKDNISIYDDIFNKYFYDRNVSKQTIVLLQEVFLNYINYDNNNNLNLSKISIYDCCNFILLLENQKSKLNYNINIKLWFDDFVVRVMEVLR